MPNKIRKECALNAELSTSLLTEVVSQQDKTLSVRRAHANVELENAFNADKDTSSTIMEFVLKLDKTVLNTAYLTVAALFVQKTLSWPKVNACLQAEDHT